MSELGPIPPVLQALYDDERVAPAGGAEERAQIRSRVLATIGVAAGAASAAGGTSAASAASGTGAVGSTAATTAGVATITGKLVVLAVTLGALGGGVYWRVTSSAAVEQSVVAPPAAPAPARVAAPSPSAPAANPRPAVERITGEPSPGATGTSPRSPSAPVAIAPSRPQPSPPPPPPPPAAPAPAPPASEQPAAAAAPENAGSAAPPQHVLLARAWAALERGEAETALELVERHHTAHPDSPLAEEREALRIVALRRLHRNAEARAGAKVFADRYPDSIHRPLVDPALEEAP